MTNEPKNNNISEYLTDGKVDGIAEYLNDFSSDVVSLQKKSISHEERRNYKDSVFVDLFYTDENAGENLLSLYNALYDDSLTDIHARTERCAP
ncbi:MAG: hypothetical protein ACI4D7_01775 [Lachnospiraceae bacterium]